MQCARVAPPTAAALGREGGWDYVIVRTCSSQGRAPPSASQPLASRMSACVSTRCAGSWAAAGTITVGFAQSPHRPPPPCVSCLYAYSYCAGVLSPGRARQGVGTRNYIKAPPRAPVRDKVRPSPMD